MFVLVCRQEPIQAGRMKSQKYRRSDNQFANKQELSDESARVCFTFQTKAEDTFQGDDEICHIGIAIIEHGQREHR